MDQRSSARAVTQGDGPDRRTHVQLVSDDELEQFERHAAAERLDRLTADQNLVTALQLERFEGQGWQVFARALA
jgi:hypothetical protein